MPPETTCPTRRKRISATPVLVLLLAAIGVLIWLWSRPATRVTVENYARITTGMTEAEVRAVLGTPTGELHGADMPIQTDTRTLCWRDSNDRILVTYRQGRVVSHSGTFRNAPKDEPIKLAATISEANFGKLRHQMPFDAVKQLLGPPTREEVADLPMSGVRFRMVYWERGFENVSLQFRDEKLQQGIGAINGKMLSVRPERKP